MPSLDSNVILRWLIGDVPEQAAQVDELMVSGARFAVEDVAVVEVVFVLERVMRLSRSVIHDSIGMVLSTACLELNRGRWIDVMSQYVNHPKQSVVDIYLAVRAGEDGATPLYTFDRELAAQHPGTSLVPAGRGGVER